MSSRALTDKDIVEVMKQIEANSTYVNPHHVIMPRSLRRQLLVHSYIDRNRDMLQSECQHALEGLLGGRELTPDEAYSLCDVLSQELMNEEDDDVKYAVLVLIRAHLKHVGEDQRAEIEARMVFNDL